MTEVFGIGKGVVLRANASRDAADLGGCTADRACAAKVGVANSSEGSPSSQASAVRSAHDSDPEGDAQSERVAAWLEEVLVRAVVLAVLESWCLSEPRLATLFDSFLAFRRATSSSVLCQTIAESRPTGSLGAGG